MEPPLNQRPERLELTPPINLATPQEIHEAITIALEEEKIKIQQEHGVSTWTDIKLILQKQNKQAFFNRVTDKLPSTLRDKAIHAANLAGNVRSHHIKYENLDKFLISLNYFLGQQEDLQYAKTTKNYEYETQQNKRSIFYRFLKTLRI